jgi:hypothetical protein
MLFMSIFHVHFYFFPSAALNCAADDNAGVIARPVLSCMDIIADVTGVATPEGAGVVLLDAGALLL